MDFVKMDMKTVVAIVLEDTGTEITVHKDVLCAHSDFAKACLESNFLESQEGRIVLKDESDEASLRTLISWMYCSEPMLPVMPTLPSTRAEVDEYWLALMKLYLMADKYVMVRLKKKIMLHCIQTHKANFSIFGPEVLRYVVENSSAVCNLRRLVIDIFVRFIVLNIKKGDQSYFKKHPGGWWITDARKVFSDQLEVASLILQGLFLPDEPKIVEENYCSTDDVDGVSEESEDKKRKSAD